MKPSEMKKPELVKALEVSEEEKEELKEKITDLEEKVELAASELEKSKELILELEERLIAGDDEPKEIEEETSLFWPHIVTTIDGSPPTAYGFSLFPVEGGFVAFVPVSRVKDLCSREPGFQLIAEEGGME